MSQEAWSSGGSRHDADDTSDRLYTPEDFQAYAARREGRDGSAGAREPRTYGDPLSDPLPDLASGPVPAAEIFQPAPQPAPQPMSPPPAYRPTTPPPAAPPASHRPPAVESAPVPAVPAQPVADQRRPLTQRELVAMSLIACPGKA